MPGRIVLLNGASSSGKSTVARALLDVLDGPWFHMGVDMFGAMRSERGTHQLDAGGLAETLRRTRAGFHRAVAGMALAGNDVVADHVLSEQWRYDDFAAVTEGVDVVLVAVWCPLDELVRREQLRGDRAAGIAESQFAQVYSYDADIRVDTSSDSAEACAAQIADHLARLTGCE